MNGIKYLLDTNALISFFQGNPSLGFLTSAPAGISIISILEFLSFSGINENAKTLLFDFIKKIEVFELRKDNQGLINAISDLRISFKIKLPDAIIAATAMHNDLILITNDKGFSKVPLLQTSNF